MRELLVGVTSTVFWCFVWGIITLVVKNAVHDAWKKKYIADLEELKGLAMEAFDNYKQALATKELVVILYKTRSEDLKKQLDEKNAELEKVKESIVCKNVKLN